MDKLLDMEAKYKDLIDQDNSKDSDCSDSDNEDSLVIDISNVFKTNAVNDSDTDSCDSNEKKSEDSKRIKKPEGTTMEELKKYVDFYKVTKVFEQKIASLRLKNKLKMSLSMSCLCQVKEVMNNPQNESFSKTNYLKKWKSESNLNTCDDLELNSELVRSSLSDTRYEQTEFISESLLSMSAIDNEMDSYEQDPLSIDDMKPIVADLLDSTTPKDSSPKKGSIRLRKFTELVDERRSITKTEPKKLNIPVKFDLKNMKVVGQSNLQKINKPYLTNIKVSNESVSTTDNDEFNPKIEAAFSLAGSESWNTSPTKHPSPDATIKQANQTRLQIPPKEILNVPSTNIQLSGQSKISTTGTDKTVLNNITPSNFKTLVFQNPPAKGKKTDLPKISTTPLQILTDKSSPPRKAVHEKPQILNVLKSPLMQDTEQNKETTPSRKIIEINNKGTVRMYVSTQQTSVPQTNVVKAGQQSKKNYSKSVANTTSASVPVSSGAMNFLLIDTHGGTQFVKNSGKNNSSNAKNETVIDTIQPLNNSIKINSCEPKINYTFLANNTLVGNLEPLKRPIKINASNSGRETIIGNMKLVKPINISTSQIKNMNTQSPGTSSTAPTISIKSVSSKMKNNGLQIKRFEIPNPNNQNPSKPTPLPTSHEPNSEDKIKQPPLTKVTPPAHGTILSRVLFSNKKAVSTTSETPLPTSHEPNSEDRIKRLPLTKVTPTAHGSIPRVLFSNKRAVATTFEATVAKKPISVLASNPTKNGNCAVESTKPEPIELVPSSTKTAVPSTSTIAKTKLLFRKDIPKKPIFIQSLGLKKNPNIGPMRRYGCEWCKTSFARKYLLKQHVHRITCNMVYECVNCSGRRILFRNRCQLLIHLLYHYGSHRKIVINYNKLKVYRLTVRGMFSTPACVESDDEDHGTRAKKEINKNKPQTSIASQNKNEKKNPSNTLSKIVKLNQTVNTAKYTTSSTIQPSPNEKRSSVTLAQVPKRSFTIVAMADNVVNKPEKTTLKVPIVADNINDIMNKFKARADITAQKKSLSQPTEDTIMTNPVSLAVKNLPGSEKRVIAKVTDGKVNESRPYIPSDIQAKIMNIKDKINGTFIEVNRPAKRKTLCVDNSASKKLKCSSNLGTIVVPSLETSKSDDKLMSVRRNNLEFYYDDGFILRKDSREHELNDFLQNEKPSTNNISNASTSHQAKRNTQEFDLDKISNNHGHGVLKNRSNNEICIEENEDARTGSDSSEDEEASLTSKELCPVCKKNTKSVCFDHNNTPDKMYVCTTYCQAVMSNLCSLTVHKNLHERRKPFICPTCGKEFEMYKSLSEHMTSKCKPRVAVARCSRCCTNNKPYYCNFTVEYLPHNFELTTLLLKKHFEQVHFKMTQSDFYNCEICGSRVSSVHDTLVHFKYHFSHENYSLNYSYKCSTCGTLLDSRKQLCKHTCGEK